MFIFRAVLALKQNCLKGIDFPGSPCSHAPLSFPAVTVLQCHGSFVTRPTCGPAWTEHVTSWPRVDIWFSLGVGHVVGLEQYIMTHAHHTE